MKNGRFSSKKVSNAVRFTTAGSTSTCPKSGLNAPTSVMPVPSPYSRSSPAPPEYDEPSFHGLPPAAGSMYSACADA